MPTRIVASHSLRIPATAVQYIASDGKNEVEERIRNEHGSTHRQREEPPSRSTLAWAKLVENDFSPEFFAMPLLATCPLPAGCSRFRKISRVELA